MPRYFFGLWRVPMYEWYWGHTIAQIELIDIDQPITVYKRTTEKPKPGQPGFSKTADEARKDYEKWLERQKREKEQGIKIDLGTFLSTGKKVPKQPK